MAMHSGKLPSLPFVITGDTSSCSTNAIGRSFLLLLHWLKAPSVADTENFRCVKVIIYGNVFIVTHSEVQLGSHFHFHDQERGFQLFLISTCNTTSPDRAKKNETPKRLTRNSAICVTYTVSHFTPLREFYRVYNTLTPQGKGVFTKQNTHSLAGLPIL